MTETDIIFKFYQEGERPNPNCFCHYGWEGTGPFAFWKYAQAYYDSAETLFLKFTQSCGDFAVLDGIGLAICFLYRHYVELTIKYLFVKYGVKNDEAQYKKFIENGHRLNKLWNETRAIIKPLKERVGSRINLGSLDHYILEIDKFDQNEEAMRYPVKNNLEPMHEPIRLDIYNLHDRMTELFDAFEKLDHDVEGQLFENVPQGQIGAFLERYEALRPRLVWFLNSVSEINKIEEKGPVWLSLSDIKRENKRWDKQAKLFESCTDDELILFDTLYYTGQNILTGQLNLPRNPNDAKKDAVKQCIINMKHDHIEFGQPRNEAINIEMKSVSAIIRCVPRAVAAIDWDNQEVMEWLKQV